MDLQTINQLIREDRLIKFYQSPAWRALRKQALTRDNFECQECKRKGRVVSTPMHTPGDPQGNAPRGRNKNSLHVHHIKEIKDYPELALVITNLETLCQPCHNKVHDRFTTSSNKTFRFWVEERW